MPHLAANPDEPVPLPSCGPRSRELPVLTLHFDYTSPAAVHALLRLQALADRGARVEFVGIDALGLQATIPVTLDQLAELDRHGPQIQALGLQLRRPRVRPPTLGAHLLAGLAATHDLGAAWRRAVLEAYWTRGLDIGSDEVLVDLAAGVGLPASGAVDWLRDRPRRAALWRTMATERGRGVGGVPVLEFEGTLVPADLDDEDLARLAAL
jgi:2-hydroxychromene-2-carboxylate isomerase